MYSVLRFSEFNTEDAEQSRRERRETPGSLNIPLDNSRYNDYSGVVHSRSKPVPPSSNMEMNLFVAFMRSADILGSQAERFWQRPLVWTARLLHVALRQLRPWSHAFGPLDRLVARAGRGFDLLEL